MNTEKSYTGKAAAGCTVVAFIFIFIAFVTPNWLQTDGSLDNPKFVKIGLWRACFNGNQNIGHLYDYNRFYGCWWVFEEEYYTTHDILLPDFFVATQFSFTLCMTLLIIGILLTFFYGRCSPQHDKFQLLLWTTGSILILSAICGIVAVTIFGARIDYRDWMPNWEHNDVGWSYALAVLGSFTLLAGGFLFLAEAQRFRKRLSEY